jgi:hypothetical protein
MFVLFFLRAGAVRLLMHRLPIDSGRDGRFFSGSDTACIWLNVSNLPTKYNAVVGNFE